MLLSRLLLFVCLCTALFAAGCSPIKEQAQNHPCASCHSEEVRNLEASAHGQAGLACDTCHSRLENHLGTPKIRPVTDLSAAACASCHEQIQQEWAASPHGQIDTLYYPNQLSKMKKSEHPAFPKPSYGESEKVTCVYCHNPCKPLDTQLVRLPKGELCYACHSHKWYHRVLDGTPAHPYPEKDYASFQNHPHNSGGRCVTCHMAHTPGVIAAGGHTLAMRSPEGGKRNLGPCTRCHGAVATFDVNTKQAETRQALVTLKAAFEKRNNGTLPAGAAGSCDQCKRGGMEPFAHDPDLILDDAYQNYLQIERDKSLGVHNPGFALQILRDSLESVETRYKR